MSRRKKPERLAILNANTAWVTSELAKLHSEWKEWETFVATIEDHPYDRNTHSECFADGEHNLRKHAVLRTKTLVFLDNNIQGHNFMLSNEYEEPWEDITSRLRNRVPHQVHQLDILLASLQYAIVPDGFWKEQGKKMMDSLAKSAPEKAADVAASWLRNPLSFT
ncbi:hypothetical protein BC374_24215 [Ensifer sp. LC13]|nr:hypothetical protein BBX50_23995 [Ensifer sp. LC11]OCP07083.1 hypothetical protein BC374_24215 [Ensifer sp. LC13]